MVTSSPPLSLPGVDSTRRRAAVTAVTRAGRGVDGHARLLARPSIGLGRLWAGTFGLVPGLGRPKADAFGHPPGLQPGLAGLRPACQGICFSLFNF